MLTFVVVGGGPTGALAELINHAMVKDFPGLDLHDARVILLEANDHLIVRVGRSDTLMDPYLDCDGVPLSKGGGTHILSAYGQWKGTGRDGILFEIGLMFKEELH